MTTTTAPAWPRTLAAYRKAIPQVAVVAAYGWAVISDRLTTGGALDGVTYVAAVFAVAQAAFVLWPKEAWTKAVWSLVAVAGQAVTAAISDGHVTVAEASLIVGALIAWATGAAAVNAPALPGPIPGTKLRDAGSAAVTLVAKVGALLLVAALLALLVAALTPARPANHSLRWTACPAGATAWPWARLAHDTCAARNWRGPLVVHVRSHAWT